MIQREAVVITGAAKGIGRHIARTFAAEGARLVLADIEPLDTVAEEVRALGAEALAITTDVRNEDEVRALMEQAVSRFGRVDVLINNAAIVTHFEWGMPRWPRIRDMDKGFWDRVLGTNLGGTFLCTKQVLPVMEAQRSGHIVNLANPESRSARAGACAYSVSKVAIGVFTRLVAEEEREWNICVVGMTPGAAIATEEAPEEARQRMTGLDYIGNSFVLAARAGMDLSGHQLSSDHGRLTVLS